MLQELELQIEELELQFFSIRIDRKEKRITGICRNY
jgi:hypothetical protein